MERDARTRRHRTARATRGVRMLAPTADGAVLLNVATGTYLRLNPTALAIVELDAGGATPEHAASVLAARWSVAYERALEDVRAVLLSIETLSAPRRVRGRAPTASGVLRVAREWARLPGPLRRITLEAGVVVVLVEVGLHVLDLSRLSRLCGTELLEETDGNAPSPQAGAGPARSADAALEWAIHWVLARWSYDATCLRQALAFGHFVRRRGPVMRLGLVEGGSVAHAWIEVDGYEYNPAPVVSAFGAGRPSSARGLGGPTLQS